MKEGTRGRTWAAAGRLTVCNHHISTSLCWCNSRNPKESTLSLCSLHLSDERWDHSYKMHVSSELFIVLFISLSYRGRCEFKKTTRWAGSGAGSTKTLSQLLQIWLLRAPDSLKHGKARNQSRSTYLPHSTDQQVNSVHVRIYRLKGLFSISDGALCFHRSKHSVEECDRKQCE